jgi:hypothetical protein
VVNFNFEEVFKMLWLSEIMIQNPDMENFEQLKEELKKRAAQGELFF